MRVRCAASALRSRYHVSVVPISSATSAATTTPVSNDRASPRSVDHPVDRHQSTPKASASTRNQAAQLAAGGIRTRLLKMRCTSRYGASMAMVNPPTMTIGRTSKSGCGSAGTTRVAIRATQTGAYDQTTVARTIAGYRPSSRCTLTVLRYDHSAPAAAHASPTDAPTHGDVIGPASARPPSLSAAATDPAHSSIATLVASSRALAIRVDLSVGGWNGGYNARGSAESRTAKS